jgi:cobyric acid synthase CobQ/L-threonine-O-3-phosphate decarboxylase
MTGGHGGHIRGLAERAGCEVGEILDFSANINPLGPPAVLRSALARAIDDLEHYPDIEAKALTAAIARRYGVAAGQVVVGNGSTELLYAVARAVKASRAVVPVPSYADYAAAAELAGLDVEPVGLREERGYAVDFAEVGAALRGGELVFLGQPNNPTGLALDVGELRRLAAERAGTMFVVDEAFADFMDGYDAPLGGGDLPANVIVLRSLTKFYAIPGLRLGFAAAAAGVADAVRRQVPPWSVNTLAQAAGAAILADEGYVTRTREAARELRESLARGLSQLPGLYVYPGAANFLLVRLNRAGMDAAALAEALLRRRIAIRLCDNYPGLDGRFFRVAVRPAEENARLLEALGEALGGAPRAAARRRTPAIMFQGTSSNAGKSVLTAALCRILLQDGVRVAPFKSQNMSLNSFVTADGGEMGRAQVVQAQACRLEPDVRMNPILLKPNSDTGSQVIVRGKPVGNMRVGEYVRYKPRAFAEAKACYDSLAAEFDAIVLEGAGSPGEVNLKSHDIVNMPMARHAGSPVLVVGDIDRGGVYASFVGTFETLDGWERRLLAGWVVNRFRGDAGLLGDAHEYVLARTGKPVLGVVPYLHSLGIPQEDSVEFKSGAIDCGAARPIEIAVIDLPHISNFTDFDALSGEADVHVRIVRRLEDLRAPDAVILPGSKNTLSDLAYLRNSGLAGRILELAAAGRTEIVGICAGFQMLGRRISDPRRIESADGGDDGLGLLDVRTTLAAEKTLTRARATHRASGMEVAGYEIHHGVTDVSGAAGLEAVLVGRDGAGAGAGRTDARVWGAYLHGLFDADGFRRWFVDGLRVRKGLSPLGGAGSHYDIEPALDRLADVVRRSLDMEAIYRIMGL